MSIFFYDGDSLLTIANGYTISRNTSNGLSEGLSNTDLSQTRSYNSYGETEGVSTQVNGNTIYAYTLGYNDIGKITTKTETLDNGTVNTYIYSYDNRRRLDTVTLNGVLIEDYGYDENGNRILQTNNLSGINNQVAVYNIGDQLVSDGVTTYDYDADGYLRTKTVGTDVTTYTYDTRGRLKQVQTPTQTISYQHNAMGNRVAKLINGAVVEKYLWLDKTTLLATYNPDGTLKQRFEYTDGHVPDSYTEAGDTYYIVKDHLGSPRAITDHTGTVLRTFSYDSFGNIIGPRVGPEIPFGFAGGLFDKDTGLIRFGYRDYDPQTGRWTARDPIGFVDPDGRILINAVGAVLGGAAGGFVALATGQSVTAGIISGSVSGFGLGGGIIVNALYGAVGAGIGYVAEASKCGISNISIREGFKSAALGAVGGVVGRQIGVTNGVAAARAGARGSILGESGAVASGFYAQSVGGAFASGAITSVAQ